KETVGLIEEKGVRALSLRCDVSDGAQANEVVKAVSEQLGAPDILVNNAGIVRDALAMRMTTEDFRAVLDTNLTGAFNMIHACLPIFIRRRSGRIVNISSVAGMMGNPGQANYSASKAGLIGLTKTIARELASRNVCCNAIAPGMIQTDMTAAFSEDDSLFQQIPLGRMGQPEEIAELAAFLAGDGSNYITGEVIRVDGGLAI
ncbi:MAG: 3-oxoacyl-ACP reductase FabG, partial [Candidatus Onthomonas sp.]|nr:3-oxoacyl-ACP reductase FabG [Candidatus Onthomonas sp.]